jgi:phage virion morphogenesis protein
MATDTAILEALYNALQPGGRRQLMRGIVQAVRREQTQRIARQVDPAGDRFAPRAPAQKRKDQARGPMFRRLRLIKHTVTQASENEGLVGFKSRAERIARVVERELKLS